MGRSRWWFLPLAVAIALDIAMVLRYELSAGMTVSRAIVMSAGGGACETSTLVRTSSASSPTDDLYVTDTWTQNQSILSVAANPQFGPGGALVPQSQETIAQGLDIESQQAEAVPPALARSGKPALVANYLAQLHQGEAWVSGPCVPFANPMRSHLRAVGGFDTADGTYTVYRGRLATSGGADEFAKSEVWLGVRADGRIGFELLRQLPAPGADLSIVFVAKLFTYPGQQLTLLEKQPAQQRVDFYDADYQDMLLMIQKAEALGPPVPALAAPPSSSAAPGSAAGASAEVAATGH